MKGNFVLAEMFVIVLVFLMCESVSASCPAGMTGDGTPENPCMITNCTQLQAMNENLSAHYKIGNNINCSDTINWNGGAGFSPIGRGDIWDDPYIPFTGSLDGNEKNITGLYINRSSPITVGLFGSMKNAIIRNVHLREVNITGNKYVGALSGWAQDTLITNCSSKGTISISNHGGGGLVGRIESTSIYDSYSDVDVSGSSNEIYYAGGLVGIAGHLGQDTIERCFATGNVTSLGTCTGGLIGHANTATVRDCFATGNVFGNSTVGGLIGDTNGANIYNSYATGNVSGDNKVGGLVGALGTQYGASGIYNSYSIGSVSGNTNVGGLLGDNTDSGTTTNCSWWTGSGPTYAIGNPSANVTYNQANKSGFYYNSFALYSTWDFNNVWYERSNDFPMLRGFEYLFHSDCNCSSCEECNEKLNNTFCSIVILNASITNQNTTCINNPERFNNKIFDCQDNIIRGDNSNNIYGIYLENKFNNTIRNCNIMNFYNGIILSSSANNILTNNNVSSNHVGIYLWNSLNNTLEKDKILENHLGIFSKNSDSLINSNIVCDNTNSDFSSSDWKNSSGNNNTCDNQGIWVDYLKTTCTYSCSILCKQYDFNKDESVDIFDAVQALEYLNGEKDIIYNKKCSCKTGNLTLQDVLNLMSEL